MRGVNIQKVIVTKEEFDELRKALGILERFSDDFDSAIADNDLQDLYELTSLLDEIGQIKNSLDDFIIELDYTLQ